MVNYDEAHRLVSAWLRDQSTETNIELELLEPETLEVDFGWVFFYTFKTSQNGDFKDVLAGNAPVIVDRTIGSLHITGTSRPTADYIEEFRSTRAMVGLSTASFVGSPADDSLILARLPRDYAEFLQSLNGCIVFDGGLHIRGASDQPDWHSLRRVWIGEDRLSEKYPKVRTDDVPFAQDCVGDQFLIRSGSVLRLDGETGEIDDLGVGWREFFFAAAANPIKYLSLEFLEHFRNEGGCLEPGQLLSVLPPFCTEESANGVSLRAISALERIRFLADFAAQITGLSSGSKIRLIVR